MTSAASRTLWLVFSAKAIRTFCYGYLGILVPLYLAALGLGATGIGVAVTLMLAASAILTLLVRRPAERRGGRVVLIALAWLVVVSVALLAPVREPALVVLAAMLGNVAVSTGETGPFLSIEQVLVARVAGRDVTLRMSLYTLAPSSGSSSCPAWSRLSVLGGVLKIVYDLLPYRTCRRAVPVSGPERAD